MPTPAKTYQKAFIRTLSKEREGVRQAGMYDSSIPRVKINAENMGTIWVEFVNVQSIQQRKSSVVGILINIQGHSVKKPRGGSSELY